MTRVPSHSCLGRSPLENRNYYFNIPAAQNNYMKFTAFAALFAVIILAALATAFPANALEGGTIFSTGPGTGYKCVYVNLPEDLGISFLNRTSETLIEADKVSSPWVDTTYSKVVMEPGVDNKNPVCFYYAGKTEGEFSFYSISLSSKDLDVSSSISGGLCVSSYEDVDTDVVAGNETDVCKLLSQNSNIVDLSFSQDVTPAEPGETLTKTLYVTSYANLRIRLSISTNLQNDFSESVVVTSPSRPSVSKSFKIKAPQNEGDYELNVLAKVEGCDIQACRMQKNSIISVKQGGKKGFYASVIPKNINLKIPGEVSLRVAISNYDEQKNFTLNVSANPAIRIEPAFRTVVVGQGEEKTAVFTAFPGNESLYEIDFRISTSGAQNEITSYISVGELLTDALRYSADTEAIVAPDLAAEIAKARTAYEAEYNKTSYGEEIPAYESFMNTIDDARKTTEEPGDGATPPNPEENGFNWMILAIPIIVIAAILLIFVAFKKAKSGSSDSNAFQDSFSSRDERE